MNTLMGILIMVVLLVGINGRHVDNNDYEDLPEAEHTDLLNRMRDSQMRHRRRSRQMYGYDYSPPFYYPDRRDYTHQQEEYLARIIKSLDEIISNMRRAPPPPPPPQPIYIPYPVVHYRTKCTVPKPTNTSSKPNTTESFIPGFDDRILEMEDELQNWGQVPVEISDDEFEGDGSRPISFVPVEPSRPIKPAPPVDHGTNQVGIDQTTRAPEFKPPGKCQAAILTCCSERSATQKKNCFARYGCSNTYATNRACDPAVIQRVLDNFGKAYGPSTD